MSRRNPLNERNTKAAQKEQPNSVQRSSAASLKPKRRAADSVRVVDASKKSGTKTKSEMKADRERRRTEENRIYTVAAILLENHDQYKKFKRVFWVLLGLAIIITLSSFGLNYLVPPDHISRYIVIGLAYVFVLASFLIDLMKVRPIRKAARLKAAKMSKRQMNEVLEAHYLKLEQEKSGQGFFDKVKKAFK